jgi:prepilin peptidase CpaA
VLLYVLGLGVCVVAAITDVRRGQIPNLLTYPLLGAAPALHVARAMARGQPLSLALGQAGLSLLGVGLCGLIPLLLWKRGVMGGGDVKLLGGIGALLLPRAGFELELHAFLVAGALALLHVAVRGELGRALVNVGRLILRFVPARAREPRGASRSVGAFRLGPSFALAFVIETWIHWEGPC